MIFTIEALAAKEGDCLLLHWGAPDNPRLAVIDGGPGRVFEDSLYPRLNEIIDNRGLDQLVIDMAMVSHIDTDHIVGIRKLFAQLKEEIEDRLPPSERAFRVDRLWYNTFNDILNDSTDQYYKDLTASYQANVGGSPDPLVIERLKENLEDKNPGLTADDAHHRAFDISLILAGHKDGRTLRDLHQYLANVHETQPLNAPFAAGGASTLITASRTPEPLDLNGLSVQVVGPLEAEIEQLQADFDEFLEENGPTAESLLAAYADESINNLSSIVCVLECDTKRILLTGDARGDKILEGLSDAGLLTPAAPYFVHVLKVPHHGSDRNVTREFFDAIFADTYLISADGKHGNPDLATITWIAESRGPDAEFQIVLTYPPAHIDEVVKAKKKAAWDPKKHSLKVHLDRLAAEGYRFSVKAGAPVKIELGADSISW